MFGSSRISTVALPILILLGFAASPSSDLTPSAAETDRNVSQALEKLYKEVPQAREIGRTSKGVLVFPKIVKAGFLVGWSAPVTQIPGVCRHVVCEIGGYSDVRQAVEQAGVDILYARTRAGVLAYGSDADVRAAFDLIAITPSWSYAMKGVLKLFPPIFV